jgi:hypothetical protein
MYYADNIMATDVLYIFSSAMTWCPFSSSISKARFVTAGAISMKLGVRIAI